MCPGSDPKYVPFLPLDIYAAVDDETSSAGFGKIFPTPCSGHEEEAEEEDDEIPSEFISKRELEKGRISKKGDSCNCSNIFLTSTINACFLLCYLKIVCKGCCFSVILNLKN